MVAKTPYNRERLLLSLVTAIADHPRASMGELASLVGISRATLSRHFSSRDVMVQAMSAAAISHAELAFTRANPHEGIAEEALKRLITELLPIAELYAYIGQAELNDKAIEAKVEPLRSAFTALFHQWQSTGELRVDLPASWLVESMSSLLRSAAAMIRSGRLARHDAIDNVFSLLWRGIGK